MDIDAQDTVQTLRNVFPEVLKLREVVYIYTSLYTSSGGNSNINNLMFLHLIVAARRQNAS